LELTLEQGCSEISKIMEEEARLMGESKDLGIVVEL
jgi:hypothetical protein